MRPMHVTDEAMAAIRLSTDLPFEHGAKRIKANGTTHGWLVLMSDHEIEHMANLAFPGETFSDTIIRITEFYRSGGKFQ